LQFFSSDTDTNVSGAITIVKLDKVNHIISGTFNATLIKPDCDTVKITEGRFDMKY
jgi:hypothetical protein